MNSYRAVVIGATGAVGSSLVRELIASPLCEQVNAVVRQEPSQDLFDDPNDKLRVHVVDMDELGTEAIATARNCDAAFCTMGIGQSRKVSKAQFWKVDVEYAVSFARACKLAGVQHFSLLSAVGANVTSRMNYLHVKGIVEERVAEMRFARASLFEPSVLITKYVRYGLQDRLTRAVFPLISKFLSPKFHEITVEDLARAMRINTEKKGSPGVESLTYPDFRLLLDSPPLKVATAFE